MTLSNLEKGFLSKIDYEYGFKPRDEGIIFESIPQLLNYQSQPKHFHVTNRSDILQYLQEAIYYNGIKINPSVFCVLNVADYYIESDFKTLVFCEEGQVFKTKESTTQIMNRHLNELGLSYDAMRTVFLVLSGEERHCLPYVLGKYRYLPLHGPSKKSVTWISLSHLRDYQKCYGKSTELELLFDPFHRIDLPIRFDEFEKRLDAASSMYAFQRSGLYRFGDMFDMHLTEKEADDSTWQRNNDLYYNEKAGIEDLFKGWFFKLWKQYSHRYPNKSHPTFQKVTYFLERHFSK